MSATTQHTDAQTDQASGTETALTLLTLAAGGISSLLIVAASTGHGSMRTLFWAIDVPAMAIVAAVFGYARYRGINRLAQRIGLGVIAGIILTLALDAIRVGGVHLGYLPDSITMFGNMITAAPGMAEPTPASYTLGATYHLFNGISFALVYSILFGRTPWWVAAAYSIGIVEVGMMILPPMAPTFGPFGLDKYDTLLNGYFLTTLLAHLAMGIALGTIAQTFARHRGILITALRPEGARI